MLIYNNTISTIGKQKLENEDIKNKIELLVDNTLSLIKKKDEIKREVDAILDRLSRDIFTKKTMVIGSCFPFFSGDEEIYGIIRDRNWLLGFSLKDNNKNLNIFDSPNIPLYLLPNEIDQITGEIQKLTVRYMNFLNMLKEEK